MKLPESLDGSKWQVIDFISDLHLTINQPSTANAWFAYMDSLSKEANAIFVLGDWFEVWIGDDNNDPFLSLCSAVARKRVTQSTKPCEIFIMHGNRDFLLGAEFADRCHATLISDPCRLKFNDESILLTHGDALCTNDTNYLSFRATVRAPQWQKIFLDKPLEERRNLAQKMRAMSQSLNIPQNYCTEIDENLAQKWLHQYACTTLIHGHIHQPNSLKMSNNTIRHVLSDWDATTNPARLEILRLTRNKGFQRISLNT